jgi:hypothetical protein
MLLGAALLAADVVEVSKDPAAVESFPSPRASRTPPRPGRLPVPVPVFHPSIRLDALQFEIPEIEPLDLELLDRKIKQSLAKKRIALAEKQPNPMEEPESADQEATKRARRDLIHISAVQPHLLEILRPRPFIDPSAVVVIPEILPPPDPWGPIGWPGVGWIDFPLDPYGDIRLVKPLPGAKKKKKKEEEEEEPPPVIPEPGTATLLVLGLAALGIAGWRPSRNRAGRHHSA